MEFDKIGKSFINRLAESYGDYSGSYGFFLQLEEKCDNQLKEEKG